MFFDDLLQCLTPTLSQRLFFQILIYFYIPGVQHFKANDDYEVLRMDGWLNIALV